MASIQKKGDTGNNKDTEEVPKQIAQKTSLSLIWIWQDWPLLCSFRKCKDARNTPSYGYSVINAAFFFKIRNPSPGLTVRCSYDSGQVEGKRILFFLIFLGFVFFLYQHWLFFFYPLCIVHVQSLWHFTVLGV